jgi:hypothetical protein
VDPSDVGGLQKKLPVAMKEKEATSGVGSQSRAREDKCVGGSGQAGDGGCCCGELEEEEEERHSMCAGAEVAASGEKEMA